MSSLPGRLVGSEMRSIRNLVSVCSEERVLVGLIRTGQDEMCWYAEGGKKTDKRGECVWITERTRGCVHILDLSGRAESLK